ncbi:MAG: threonine synthase [Candidatus Levyibacteriota bacterium]
MAVEYVSTRGKDPRSYRFSSAILSSTAADGGLLVPRTLPALSQEEIVAMSNLPYHERAARVIQKFDPDLPPGVLKRSTAEAYGRNFDDHRIAPLVPLPGTPNQHILELWHGPTSAFKDMALQPMPRLFSVAAELNNNERLEKGEKQIHYLVLTATSGDTGKAAAEGYKDIPGVSILVYYPHGGVSRLQELSMLTQEGNNVSMHPVKGNFDNAQTAVKQVFDDTEFAKQLDYLYNTVLSSANSINWGRIAPQIAYHVSAYADLVRNEVIKPGEKIDIAVPTGNFGNILAAYYAKQMGLPVGKLVCASNENNVITEFLHTGVYDIRNRKLQQTSSPSMDILIASNIERLLYLMTQDTQKVGRWMAELKERKVFEVDGETRQRLATEFYAGWISDAEAAKNIKRVAMNAGYLMDTHTSVAQAVTEQYLQDESSSRPIVVCSTANWAKFPVAVRNALVGGDMRNNATLNSNDEFEAVRAVKDIMGVKEPANIAALADKPILHGLLYDATVQGVRESVHAYLSSHDVNPKIR